MHPSEIQREVPAPAASAVVVGAIPARFASTRLPGKALHSLAGKPMVEHVYRRAASAPGLDRVVVLTDDERIARVVQGFGGDFEMTPTECSSGTDRIAWAARHWRASGVINIQGDEPLIDPDGIARVARHLREHPEDPIVTLAADALEGDLDQASVVKVVLDRAGYALYFSRAAIPFPRHPGGASPLRHLGIYGYQRTALLEVAELAQTPLEKSESLEQLRALENGIRIRVLTGARPSWGVDTLEDAEAVDRRLREELGHPIATRGGER